MRMYWWQAGLHIQSESEEDHERLVSLWHLLQDLKLVDRREEFRTNRGGRKVRDQESIVGVESVDKPVKE